MLDVVIGFKSGCLNGWILAVTRPDTLDEPHPFTESDTITLRQLCVDIWGIWGIPSLPLLPCPLRA